METVIRECRPEEAEAVLLLWRQAETTPSPTDTVEDLRRVIADGPAVVLVAEEAGQLVGSLIGGFDGWRANLYRLAVHPDWRRGGHPPPPGPPIGRPIGPPGGPA